MDVAALLLTGGASRRMGTDKATLIAPDGRALAARTAALLATVAHLVVEVGPGYSGAAVVADRWPGAGPLAAVASGVAALDAAGSDGAALVVATDLPGLEASPLAWLADHPAAGNVIPVVDGRLQLLCARYDRGTLAGAVILVEAGRRRMQDLIEGRPAHLAWPHEWSGVAAEGSLRDADTPAALAAFGNPAALAALGDPVEVEPAASVGVVRE